MTIKEQKREWYEKNKEFEKNIYFKIYRNQRLRVKRLKLQLYAEEKALSQYFNRMNKEREKFKLNLKKNKGGTEKEGL